MQHFGRIDVVINNAGVGAPGALLEQSDDAITAQWDLHVAAPIRLTREALPALKASRGHVFFVGSGVARVPTPYFGAYPAAKAAIRAVAGQLRRELRPIGVAVTYADPGAVDTEFSQASGMERAAKSTATTSPAHVAKRILNATRKRPRRVNAVPWQTAAVVLGEWLPRIADLVISRVVDKPAAQVPATAAPQPQPQPRPEPQPPPLDDRSDFEKALEPVARRMERVKLPQRFLAELLQPNEELQLGDVAMRWAGMPNKNERAAVGEALDALCAGGFLEKTGDERWRVLRSAD
jgi:NAD(P)-dependent dehydrogenase (short-subunit alcohol dehydrogenase family)